MPGHPALYLPKRPSLALQMCVSWPLCTDCKSATENNTVFLNPLTQVVELPGHCYACGAESHTRMFPTSIPHFKVCGRFRRLVL